MENYISHSENETVLFGKEFAKKLSSHDIVVLSGELGARQN